MDLDSSPWTELDGPSVVRAGAALQLLQENIPCLLRTQRLAAVGARLPHRPASPRLSTSSLRGLLRGPVIADPSVLGEEDPYDDVYVAEVAFHGGPRLVMQGLTNRSAHTANLMLQAIFGPGGDALPEQYIKEARALAYGVLDVSNQICLRAGLRRGMAPPPGRRDEVFVPNRDRMAQLEGAVSFADAELSNLLQPDSLQALERLTVTSQSLSGDWDGSHDGRLIITPLVRADDQIIVAYPSELAAALRHHLIVLAMDHDCRDALASAFRQATVAQVQYTLLRLGAEPLEAPVATDSPLVTRQRFRGEANTIIDVGVLTDSLTNYDPDDPFGHWDHPNPGGALQDVLDPIGPPSPDDEHTFRLAVTDGVARSTFFGLQENRRSGPMLLVSLDELKVMVTLDGEDPLFLWRFAQAHEDLHEAIHVMMFSILDEYAIYRQHEQSFYLSDEQRPTFLSVTPGSAVDLRVEAQRKEDAHQVASPVGRAFVELVSLYGTDTAPIYAVSPQHSLWAFAVELPDVRVWVLPDPRIEGGLVRFLGVVAEAIAYWMWRIGALAGDAVRNAADRRGDVLISLTLDDAAGWERTLAGHHEDQPTTTEEPPSDSPWASASLPAPGPIVVTLRAQGSGAPRRGDNTGDRQLVEALLTVLAPLSPSALPVDALLSRLLPNEQTRMIQVTSASDVLMRPISASPRMVVPAVTGRLLDDLGGWLASQGLSQGPIPAEERTNVLRRSVDYYVQRLGERIARLSPDGLLDFVMLRDEALLRDDSLRNEYLSSRLACFGPESVLVQDLVQDERKHTEAAVASRFLIEFIAATPPSGGDAVDLFAYDELLACSAEIISRATLSDAIHYGFSDVQLSLLASGRLGVSRGDRYTAGTQDLLETEMEARRTLALEPPPRSGASPSVPLDQINPALEAEVGFTLTDLVDGLGTLVMLSDELQANPTTMHKADVAAHLQADRGWNEVKAEAFIAALSLGSRQDFMSQREAWPWKYNRDLSYIRRPIVRVENDAVNASLTWGVRRIWVTPRYWGDLLSAGRYKAKTKIMERLVGSVRQGENKQFEKDVEATLKSAGMSITGSSVKRIAKQRLVSETGDDLGDIDALGIDVRRRLIVVAEAKDFELARTPAELANEATDLVEGKKSAVSKVIRRAQWIERHLALTLQHFRVSADAKGWQVIPVVVTSRNLITPRVMTAAVPVVAIEGLRRWTSGLSPARARRRK